MRLLHLGAGRLPRWQARGSLESGSLPVGLKQMCSGGEGYPPPSAHAWNYHINLYGEQTMNIETTKEFLLWCVVINYCILIIWFLAFRFAHNWIFCLHSSWFNFSEEQFDVINYAGMAIYKIGVFLFNLVPFIALLIIGHHAG